MKVENDFFEPDIIDKINLELYEEFNSEGLASPESFEKYAEAYYKAVNFLINFGKESIPENFKKFGVLPIFTLGHLCIELYLKSLLALKGIKIKNTHNLNDLVEAANKCYKLKDLTYKISGVNEISYNGFAFRYPIDTQGNQYGNLRVKLNPMRNFYKEERVGNKIVGRGMKQSPTKNFLHIIEDIAEVTKELKEMVQLNLRNQSKPPRYL